MYQLKPWLNTIEHKYAGVFYIQQEWPTFYMVSTGKLDGHLWRINKTDIRRDNGFRNDR